MSKKPISMNALNIRIANAQDLSTCEGLLFDNIFDVVDEDKAICLKESSDMCIGIREILTTCQISNSAKHQLALKRIEQIWNAEPNTELGNELDELVRIVCSYEEQFLS
ncbi:MULTISPECIES: hypothetical protein [Shewanella]|uniref:Uncharacterized protein n=1 Tax=Shewanella livingstonensis TaxID=150120 RepID=A0A3G8LYH7_9GAMM|nr:hypothetical protein [Shewanella livingstonensis]AZG74155.1 hypothetical protein EGC82_16185 [Shewanella livingstonensis]